MNRIDQNINKDMIDSDLIDLESLDFSDDQTWLYLHPYDTGNKVDILDWNLSCDWPVNNDNEYLKAESTLYAILDHLQQYESSALDRQKLDSRTFVRPKKRYQRPTIYNMVDALNNTKLQTIPQNISINSTSSNKYLTYNKYNSPMPMLRLKTFNVDTNSENSTAVKEFALKRRSLLQDEDPQLEDVDATLVSDTSERLSSDHLPSKPINIDLSQPAHNLHNTFNKGLLGDRGSLNMYQSGESIMRMSPPSLVSSMQMENSGSFHPESLEGSRSHKDSGLPLSGRASIDPMMTSMTLSILDEKDMSTSFLSQTTYPDNDSLMDSLPPSLVNSVNNSYIVSNSKFKSDSQHETNIFSSATFTHLEQSEKLLSGRPRCPPVYNTYKRDSNSVRNSVSYVKSREEACQINTVAKELAKSAQEKMGETITLHYNDKYVKESEKENLNATFETDDAFYKEMGVQKEVEVIRNSLNVTLGKQELNEIKQARKKLSIARKALPSEEKPSLPNQVEEAPIKTIQLTNQKISVPKYSLDNVTDLLNRRRLMQTNASNVNLVNSNSYSCNVAKTNSANSHSLNEVEKEEFVQRETPRRNATFKKSSPRACSMDATVVFNKSDEGSVIDINSATLNLIDGERVLEKAQTWGSQDRAMVGSNESTDTGTFSSSSPPESVPAECTREKSPLGTQRDRLRTVSPLSSTPQPESGHTVFGSLFKTVTQKFGEMFSGSPVTNTVSMSVATKPVVHTITNTTGSHHLQVASTPITQFRKNTDSDLLNVHNTISPIFDNSSERQSLTKANLADRTYESHNATVINSATMVKRSPPKRDILAAADSPVHSPETRPVPPNSLRVHYAPLGSNTAMAPPASVVKKTGLPMSKLRQYSSHRELNRIPAASQGPRASNLSRGGMSRRGVYGSNPALSPPGPCPPALGPIAPPGQGSHAPPSQTPLTAGDVSRNVRRASAETPALVRQGTETLLRQPTTVFRDQEKESTPPPAAAPVATPAPLVRQGTETLRRERPQSHLVMPRDLRPGHPSHIALPTHVNAMRSHNYLTAPTNRQNTAPATGQNRVLRTTSGLSNKPAMLSQSNDRSESVDVRASALPRPSRLPGPRRGLRPPSVYTVAPAGDLDHY